MPGFFFRLRAGSGAAFLLQRLVRIARLEPVQTVASRGQRAERCAMELPVVHADDGSKQGKGGLRRHPPRPGPPAAFEHLCHRPVGCHQGFEREFAVAGLTEELAEQHNFGDVLRGADVVAGAADRFQRQMGTKREVIGDCTRDREQLRLGQARTGRLSGALEGKGARHSKRLVDCPG
ncbi:hypothetical protein [Caballeronia arationis]|uniref:hypothetical protein n=1 Tax=Caballeronia arationis TaxID=1777142 RepID=UPI0014227D86